VIPIDISKVKSADFNFFVRLVVCLIFPLLLGAGTVPVCEKIDEKDFSQISKRWQGRELVAFASWCSSCKKKLMSTKLEPDKFLFISVFEEPSESASAMERLGLFSPCIYGDGLAERLGIDALPWAKKI